MPDFIANCAGTTRTTGTADFVISGTPRKRRSLADALTDAQSVAYFAEYSGDKDGFEEGVGTWDEDTLTLARTTVTRSSNEDTTTKFVFGVGEKTVTIIANINMLTDASQLASGTVPIARVPTGTTAGTVALADDARFNSVAVDAQTAASALTGAELVPGLQGSTGVKITTEAIKGTPFQQKMGFATTKTWSEHSDFSRIRTTGYASANNGTLDLEPYAVRQSGTAAAVTQGMSTLFTPCAVLSTGTDTNGYLAIEHMYGPNLFAPGTTNIQHRMQVNIPTAPDGTQSFTFRSGFWAYSSLPTLTRGMYLQASNAAANWQAVVMASGGTTTEDTEVAIAAATEIVLRVHYDGAAAATKYYINDVLVRTILDSTRVMDLFTQFRAGAFLLKTAGNTARTVQIKRHTTDYLWAAVPYF